MTDTNCGWYLVERLAVTFHYTPPDNDPLMVGAILGRFSLRSYVNYEATFTHGPGRVQLLI